METIRKEEISEVHFQHTQWINLLDFYSQELNIFQNRLEEISVKNIGQEIQHSIQEFQSKFISLHTNLSNLRNQINGVEQKSVEADKLHVRRIDYQSSSLFVLLHADITQFEKLYKELRIKFLNFLSAHM